MKNKIIYKSNLIVKIIDDNKYCLVKPFTVVVILNDISATFRIEPNFKTDFASVPRWFFTYLIAGNRGKKEATLHDWMYQNAIISKKYADEVFYLGLKQNKRVNSLTAWLMYRAVRLFGKGEYK